MLDKYYTPELSEFHIGFKYEWLNENSDWVVEETPKEISIDGFDEQTYGLRVKYLDSLDIESLGFVYIKVDSYKYPTFYKSGFGLKLMEDNLIEIVNITMNGFPRYFEGKCLNKSELIKLCKQLNIC